MLFGVLIFSGTGLQAITFSGSCENFIPAHLMDKIVHVERDGICFIDSNTDLNALMFDDVKTAKMHELLDHGKIDNRVVPLFIGNSRALLVDSDELYVMEYGNEQYIPQQAYPREREFTPQERKEIKQAVQKALQSPAGKVAAAAAGGAIAGSAAGPGGALLGAAGGAVSQIGSCGSDD